MNFSRATKMGDLLKDERAKEVLVKHFSEGLLTHPMIKMASGLSLEKMVKMSAGQIPDSLLEAADEDLKKL